MPKRPAAALVLLFFSAVLALTSKGNFQNELHESRHSSVGERQVLLRSAPKTSASEVEGEVAASAQRGSRAFVAAHTGLSQAIILIQADGPRPFPRSNEARDAVSPFNPNLLDGSDDNIALIEHHALAGSDDALAAFMTVAAHLPDYRERSHQLLLLNAARGSVLALTTLSERAVSGFGFEAPDRAASIFFEYLAWSTGRWHIDAEEDFFRPTIARNYSRDECSSATLFVRSMIAQHDAFGERDTSGAVNCVAGQ